MNLSHHHRVSNSGFSLLEMVVAVAILGISLTALYQAAGGATRIVGVDEKMAYAVELSRSLVANYAVVPPGGMSDSGTTQGGFSWSVAAQPAEMPEDAVLPEGMLQYLTVAVRWPDGVREREFIVHSVVSGQEPAE